MYKLFFVCIWLKKSIFGEFSNIYLFSAQNRVKWRHKIRPIAKNLRPILIFFARDDAKLMPGEVCQVSCWYSNKWRSYSGKTEGGDRIRPPGGGGLIDISQKLVHCTVRYAYTVEYLHRRRNSFQVGGGKNFDTEAVIFPNGRHITTYLRRT